MEIFLYLVSAYRSWIMVVFCPGEEEPQGNSSRKEYIEKSSQCGTKQIINVKKCSLGIAPCFLLPVGDLTICTLACGYFAYLQPYLSEVLKDCCRFT